MQYPKSNRYDKAFLQENMMGPNCLKMLEELLRTVQPEKGMRILDLGCGKGLTSIFLARECGARVFATDLWIEATENYRRFQSLGLTEQIIPIHADAAALPYAAGYFDAAVSIDAYHYFGRDKRFMDKKLAPLVKKGGFIALAFPGLKEEFGQTVPREIAENWPVEEIIKEFHSCPWWAKLLEEAKEITVESIVEMQGFDEFWNDWLACENEYATYVATDRAAMAAGAGQYLNFIAVIARKK